MKQTALTEQSIIIVFCLLFFFSSLYLFAKNEQGLDPNTGKDWWVLSFSDPHDLNSYSFIIENHSEESEFRYQVVSSRTVLAEQTLSIPKGTSETILPSLSTKPQARTSIIVFHGTEEREIYR